MNHQEAVEKTIAMLKGYQDQHRQIEALRYRMRHPSFVTKEEIISQMSMPGVSDAIAGSASGHISDKTMYIALNYEDRANALNEEETTRIAEKLFGLEEQEHRLLFHIGLLPPTLSQALSLHYIQGVSWKDAAKRESVSLKAMDARRTRGITMLAGLLFLDEGLDG